MAKDDRRTSVMTASEGRRARAVAQCEVQLLRLTRIARELEIDEIFDTACEFFANALPLREATLTIQDELDDRTLHWTSRASHPPIGRVTIEIGPLQAPMLTTHLFFVFEETFTAKDRAYVDTFVAHLQDALVRSRGLESGRATSGRRLAVSVLLVDDDDDLCSVLVDLLEMDGYRVRRAENGSDALAMMRKERPAIVLLDAHMPVMDGFEFRARQLDDPALRDIPVVALTVDDERKFDPGVVQLTKPFDVAHLSSRISDVLSARERRRISTG